MRKKGNSHINEVIITNIMIYRKRLDALTRANRCGLPEMTADEIRLSCLENDGYDTPELNEVSFIHSFIHSFISTTTTTVTVIIITINNINRNYIFIFVALKRLKT